MFIRYRLFLSRENLKSLYLRCKKYWNLKLLFQNPVFVGVLFIVSLIPLLFSFFFMKSRFEKLEESRDCFKQIKWRAQKVAQSQKSRNAFLKTYRRVDPNFLNHRAEPLLFLQSEIDALKVIYGHPTFQSCPAIKERLDYLTKGKNRLVFLETNREMSSLVEESYFEQSAPIQVDGDDIKKILSTIEGLPIAPYETIITDRPQLIIHRFDLKRSESLERESYYLEMNLIQREPAKRG